MAGQIRYENGEQVIEKWDEVFKAVSAEPRRQIIISLLDKDDAESVPLPEMAMNPNVPADPEALRMELHHQHLPMLAEMGFVEWDTEPLVAYQGPDFDEVAAVFEALHNHAVEIPDSLVIGCQQLEAQRQSDF